MNKLHVTDLYFFQELSVALGSNAAEELFAKQLAKQRSLLSQKSLLSRKSSGQSKSCVLKSSQVDANFASCGASSDESRSPASSSTTRGDSFMEIDEHIVKAEHPTMDMNDVECTIYETSEFTHLGQRSKSKPTHLCSLHCSG